MAEPATGSDRMRIYLTGASGDGGSQPRPADSLGGYRSSTREQPLGVHLSQPIAGIRIDHAAGANGAGTGYLRAVTPHSLSWAAPGGKEGQAVAIANGETKLLTGHSPDKHLLVTRALGVSLRGTAQVHLTERLNNAVGGGNVSEAQQAAGVTTLRCLCLRNDSADTVLEGLRIWIDEPEAGLELALEDSDPATVPEDEHDTAALDHLTWVAPMHAHTPLEHTDLAADGGQVFLWMKRTTPQGAEAKPLSSQRIVVSFLGE